MARDPADRIVRAVLALGRRLRAQRPAGAPSLSQVAILGTLARGGAMPATRLAAEERLQPQSLTRLIARLEHAGAIERRRSATDRRERTIAITPRGRRVLDAEIRARRTWLARAIRATLTPAEHATLLAAADAMLELASHAEPAVPLARRRRRRR